MIRKVIEEDRRAIVGLLSSFPKEVQPNLILELEQAWGSVVEGYIFSRADNVGGYMVLRLWGGVYHLDTLVVDNNQQGNGVGKSLVEFAKNRCIEMKIPQLNTCTFYQENIKFYEKVGFTVIGSLEGPFIPLDVKRTYLKWKNPHLPLER